MSPLGVTVTTGEILPAGAGIPTNAGTLFLASAFDQGPPPALGLTYAKCQSINDVTTFFGGRTSTSATGYDALDTYFHEGGSVVYVTRAADVTGVAATLSLSDVVPHPTVLVTATAGTNGNSLNVAVTQSTAATFTGTIASGSPNVTLVSSFANIGPGTLVTGTGIPANAFVVSVNIVAGTLVLSGNATANTSALVITPKTFTVTLTDVNANVLSTHGPYATTAQLFADTTSPVVIFSQSAGGGFTFTQPNTLAATVMTGGVNPTLTDASYVTALANFVPELGPGTVIIPGRTTATIWTGLDLHAKNNARWSAKEIADSATPATLITAISGQGNSVNGSYGAFTVSSVQVPGITPGTVRTVGSSAVVAALRAQVAATGNNNQAPAGRSWPLQYVTGFTTNYTQVDMATLSAAGINCFANRFGVLCLYGFVSPVPSTVDPIYWQAAPATERMALIAEGGQAMDAFLFGTLDGQNHTITACQTALQGLIQRHWINGALYGANASDAGQAIVSSPVNTPTTEAAGQLNAVLEVRISPFAQSVNLGIDAVPITQTLGT